MGGGSMAITSRRLSVRKPFDEQQRAVEEVLRTFSTNSGRQDTIPYSALIPGIAREIVWAGRNPPHAVRRETVRKKLAKAKESSEILLEVLLSEPSLWVTIPSELQRAIHLVAYAEVDLQGQRGRLSNDAAARVADLAAQHFEPLTGFPPTRNTRVRDGIAQPENGRFSAFLKAIYGALQIDASAVSQAKRAIAALAKNGHDK
jgi:hypothetical protein